MWEALVSLGVGFAIEIGRQVQAKKMTREEALAKLSVLAEGSEVRGKLLDEIMNSPELQAAYDAFDDALGPDPSGPPTGIATGTDNGPE